MFVLKLVSTNARAQSRLKVLRKKFNKLFIRYDEIIKLPIANT